MSSVRPPGFEFKNVLPGEAGADTLDGVLGADMSDVRAAGEALVADNRARLEAIFADALAWLESRGNAEALARLRRRARGLGVGL